MFKQLWIKLRESIISVLPVVLIVIILSFTPLFKLNLTQYLVFIFSSIGLIFGIALFNLGAETSMSVMGEQVGSALMKTKKLPLIFGILFLLGLLITIAEPDLSVLSSQVSSVINKYALIIGIGVGVGLFLVIAVIKIITKQNLSFLIMFFYMVMFALTCLLLLDDKGNFLALCYDSGGVTTGPITVPFIMALGLGIANIVGGRGAKENSFGLVALCSIGPIIAVLFLGLGIDSNLLNSTNLFDLSSYALSQDIGSSLLEHLVDTIKNVAIALGLIVAFFMIIEFIFIKMKKKDLIKIFVGILYTFLGLIIFLTCAEFGYLSIGFSIGEQMAHFSNIAPILFGLIIGMVVVLAEPAVSVLTHQVEEVTTGNISRLSMMISLMIGVGGAIGLSIIRIVFNFSILYYIIPGYLISLGLSFFVPKVYTAIAFDSGGVASGPLTSSFILPFAIGVCSVLQPENMLQDAFGVVALVALAPLISIQLLGVKGVILERRRIKNRFRKIVRADDEQIISFK
jgi:hypothetical protein